jgi:hypothetical protein
VKHRRAAAAYAKGSSRSRRSALLGGFIAESGVVLDGTLEGQLERMRRRLAGP